MVTSSGSFEEIAERLRAAGCVFAEEEARDLVEAAATADELAVMVERRAAGEPFEHVVGWVEFCGLRIVVEAGVFVPRLRTELMVAEAVARARPGAVVVDLCCGAGAVGAAVAASVGDVELHAADVDPAAVRCARRNLAVLGGHVYQGDLDGPLPAGLQGRVAVLTANVPYVPTGEIRLLPAEARLHEPRVALDGGPDGLDVLRRVVAVAPRWLAPGGHLLVETSDAQADQASQVMAAGGLDSQVVRSDELDAVVVVGRRHDGGR
jgi:release factor glutamine methyltransferase